MEKLKKMLEPTKNKIIAGVIAVLVVVGGSFGIWSFIQSKAVEPVVIFKENIVFEYGENLEQEQIIEKIFDAEKSDYTKISSIINIDTKNVTTKLDDDGKEIVSDKHKSTLKADKDGTEKEFEFAYDVKDTQAPVIEGAEDTETPFDSELKFEEFVIGTDPVDGKTKLVVEGELDTSKAGKYEMKAVATDNNGNKTEKTFVVTVLEEVKEVEEPETPATQTPSNTGGSSNTNKPSTNTGGSTQKPAEPSKPVEKPKPTEPTKPVEKPKPTEPTKPSENLGGMVFYKDYGNVDSCIAVADKEKKAHLKEWVRNLCDYDGKMYYQPN